MNKLGKRIAAAGLCAGLSMLALTGCSSVDKNEVVATVDGTEIKLGEMMVALRTSQASTESYLGAMFGDSNMWEQDLTGSGVSYGETYKANLLASFKDMVILEKHMADYNVELTEEETAAIEAATKQFIADNDEEVLKAMYADEETVARVLTLYTIEAKMGDAIRADVDTEVSDAEAAQKTMEYVLFSASGANEEGVIVDLTDEEKEEVKQQAQETIDLVKGGKTLAEAVAEIDADKTTTTQSFGTEGEMIDEAVMTAVSTLEDGEIYEEPVETEDGWYVVQMISTFDEAATEAKKAEIVTERENALYEEVLTGWEPESYEVNNEVWDSVTFDDQFLIKTEETEAASEAESEAATTEAATETEAEAATTEAASETESEAATTEAASEAESEAATTEAATETEE